MRPTILMSFLATAALAGCLDADLPPSTDPAALAAFEQLGHATAHRAYATLTPATRVTLWRTHLTRELAGERLTPTQAAIVAEVQARLPDLIEHYDAALAARAEAAFSADQLGAWFELPGRWDASVALVAPGGNDCDTRWCTTCLPPQPVGTHCGPEDCDATSSGCGWFGQQSCTRTCHLDDIPLE